MSERKAMLASAFPSVSRLEAQPQCSMFNVQCSMVNQNVHGPWPIQLVVVRAVAIAVRMVMATSIRVFHTFVFIA